MRPYVSFVFPVAPDGMELLRRAVRILRDQTAEPSSFEVVIAVDGAAADVSIEPQPFAVTVVSSPRTRGNEHLPHRNHARNRGCVEARGEYLWVLDADMLADPLAVEHLRAVTAAGRSRKPPIVSPCFAELDCTPEGWLASELDVHRHDVRSKTASGQLKHYRAGAPATIAAPTLPEGFPALPRWLFDAIGGFDERYLGWGGNKIDLCRRLRLLDTREHLIEIRLLVSVLFRHQPHARDPLFADETLRARNTQMFERMQIEAMRGAPWWRAQVAEVRRSMAAQSGMRA